jgi:hypothetical protein
MNNTSSKDKVYVTMGASNHSSFERQSGDFYATDPKAVKMLLELEEFDKYIWEPACGLGHISRTLEEAGYVVKSTDLVDRGYGVGGVDFLQNEGVFKGDIVTNPPYKYAKEFVIKALEAIEPGKKVAMFLKLTFLEGKSRYEEIFSKIPPKKVWVSRSRLSCPSNGDFDKFKGKGKAICYCWFIWQKGYTGETTIGWFN